MSVICHIAVFCLLIVADQCMVANLVASPSHPSWKSGQGGYLVGKCYNAILVATCRMVLAPKGCHGNVPAMPNI